MFNMKTGKNFFSKVPSLFFTNDFHYFPSPFCLLGVGFMGVFLPTCTHLYNKTPPQKKKNLLSHFQGCLCHWCNHVQIYTTNPLVICFQGCHPQRKPHEHKQASLEREGSAAGRNRLLRQWLAKFKDQAAPGEGRRKTVKGMTWNDYKWLVPTNKTRDLWMVKQSK